MPKKTSFYVFILLLGIGLFGTSFLFWTEDNNISAVLIGIGLSLIGSSLLIYIQNATSKNTLKLRNRWKLILMMNAIK